MEEASWWSSIVIAEKRRQLQRVSVSTGLPSSTHPVIQFFRLLTTRSCDPFWNRTKKATKLFLSQTITFFTNFIAGYQQNHPSRSPLSQLTSGTDYVGRKTNTVQKMYMNINVFL
jgi:hypothetical protein